MNSCCAQEIQHAEKLSGTLNKSEMGMLISI
nr:uncharacterized protein CTRU02_07297 [Colletotrichum truncatum]KAF6791535.1 hypothetical protein CTRU02_07297 [Colletotrichum truncatum]